MILAPDKIKLIRLADALESLAEGDKPDSLLIRTVNLLEGNGHRIITVLLKETPELGKEIKTDFGNLRQLASENVSNRI